MTIGRWQIAFLIGLIALVLAEVVSFGSVALASITSVIGLLLGIVNALIGGKEGESQSRVSGMARTLLNRPTVLSKASIGVWCLALAVFASPHLIAWVSPQARTLSGVVTTSDKLPIRKGVLSVLHGHVVLGTALIANGQFTVGIKIPSRHWKSLTLMVAAGAVRPSWRAADVCSDSVTCLLELPPAVRTIRGRIRTTLGSVVTGALVILDAPGVEYGEYTATSYEGIFRIEDVELDKLIGPEPLLRVSWRGAEQKVPLNPASESPIEVIFSETESPVRVSYFDLRGPALDRLVAGDFEPRLEARLGRPTIARNGVLRELQLLRQRFARSIWQMELPVPYLTIEQTVGDGIRHHLADLGRPNWAEQMKFLGADLVSPEVGVKNVAAELRNSEWMPLGRFERSGSNAPEFADDGVLLREDQSAFWRWATIEDIVRLHDLSRGAEPDLRAVLGLLRRIGTPSVPKGFARFVLRPHGGVCGGPMTIVSPGADAIEMGQRGMHFVAQIVPPEIAVRVLVIENPTGASSRVSVKGWTVREVSSSLRDVAADNALLASERAREKELFPSGLLMPGESFVIPLRIVAKPEGETAVEVEEVDAEAARELGRVLSSRSGTVAVRLRVNGKDVKYPTGVSCSELGAILGRAIRSEPPTGEFVYGPSIQVDAVTLNGVQTAVRSFDPDTITIAAGNEGGSCPFLYTTEAGDRGVLIGRILINAVGAKRSRRERIHITRPGLRGIVIREEEDEITYLQHVSAEYRVGDRVFRVGPSLRDEVRSDGTVVLRRGESLSIPVPLGATHVSLSVTGYYELVAP